MSQVATTSSAPPVTVRRVPLPRSEPPYDDELPEGEDPAFRAGGPAVDGALALQLPLELPLPGRPPAPLRLVPPLAPGPESGTARRGEGRAGGPSGPGADGLPRTPRDALPDPRPWAGRLVQVLVEVLAGERPASQVLRHVSLAVYADLVRAPRPGARGGGRPASAAQLRSIRVSEPADGVAEVCAVVRRGGRYRAVALRLEGLGGRWRCTALQVG